MIRHKHIFLLLLIWCLPAHGVAESLQGFQAVDRFELKRYLGTWYEIARLDNWYEWGLEEVTATYVMREDGLVHVTNKGFDPAQNTWKTYEGKGRMAGVPTVAAFRLSFLGPFSSEQKVVALDRDNYSWAMVVGKTPSFFWILSRTPDMEPALLSRLLSDASAKGIDTLRLIRTPQHPAGR